MKNLSNEHPILMDRQSNGILKILTHSERDFYYSMGIAHAIDRPIQMLLMRILGQGRATELLMDNDEMLEVDIFFRKMNWKSNLQEELAQFSEEELSIAQAYCDGVNHIILKKRPLEFKLIGYKPSKWTIEDSLLISRMTGYISLAQSQGEIERFFIELVKNGLSKQLLEELFEGNLDGCDFEKIRQINITDKIVPDGVKWMNLVSAAIASNNWVISGNKSKSRNAVLANDPHLETNRLPNVWYETEIHLNDRFFKGCTMPGLPACLIGRTNDLSWGATYTFMDAVDSWMEDVKNGQYLKNDSYHHFNERKEVIKRKKKDDFHLSIYENEHGTLDGKPESDGIYLTTKWASSSSGYQSVKAIRHMFWAKSVHEGMEQIGQLEVSFNWVLADTIGNIGYQMSGKMPVRNKNWNGFYPAPGWTSEYDWNGFVDYHELPRAINPESGYIVTANNDLNHYGAVNPINMPMGDYRARRISKLLESKECHNVEDFQKYHMDVYSVQAELVNPLLINHMSDENPLKDLLSKWNLCYEPNQVEPVIFEKIYQKVIELILSSNIGESAASHVINDTGILVDFYLNFDKILLNENSSWFINKSRNEIIKNAIELSSKTPKVTWGEINKIEMTNMFFGGKLPKILGFDKGPVKLRGGRSTIHQGQIYRSAGRLTSFTPSYRFITDMGENTIHSCLAGGASDNRWSKFYANEIENWRMGNYKTF